MSGYTKLSSTLIASSVWNEPDKTRIVWITMLAMADKDGNVRASMTSLAYLCRESVQDTKDAIRTLESPDPESGRKEMEGRRIVPIEGGWHLVTHAFYREEGMSEEARTYWREKQRFYRAKSKTKKDGKGQKGTSASASVSVSSSVRKRIVKEKPAQIVVEDFAQEIGQPRSDGTAMFLHFEDHGWPKNWRLKIQKWKAWGYLASQKAGGKNGSNGRLPECLKFTPPKDWEEARRIARLLQTQKDKHPEHAQQIQDRIEVLQAQFQLKL